MRSSNFLPVGIVIVTACVCFGIRKADADTASAAEQRMQKLESKIAALEADNARLKSVVSVDGNKNLTVDGASLTFKSSATTSIQSAAATNIKGAVINLN